MLRRHRLIRMQLQQFADACIFGFAFWMAAALRANPQIISIFGRPPPASDFEGYFWILPLLMPAAPLTLEWVGFYSRPLSVSRWATSWQLFKGCLLLSLGLVLASFLFRLELPRGVPFLFGAASFLLVLVKEEFLLWLSSRQGAHTVRRFILVGAREETARIRRDLKAKSQDPIEIVAELELNENALQRLVEALHEYSVNGVIVSAKRAVFDQVEIAIRACELEGVEVWLVADFFKTQISRTSFDDFFGHPILVFRTVPEASWQVLGKQLLDFVGALVGIVLLALPLAVVALMVRLTSPGPVLFRQQRSGLNGRPFALYKFRTMVTNAEQLKHELEAMNEMSGPVFKVTDDPRITPVGRFLRKFSIDELPQLYNVLRGEMSLVGPRPLPVDEVKRFNDLAHRRRLSVKPGLTCLWQISGRNEVKDFRDWVRLDLEYIDNWSLWLDVKILFRTLPAVLAGTGAK